MAREPEKQKDGDFPRFFGEGEVIRDPDGRLRFRAGHGAFGLEHPSGIEESTTSTSLTDLSTIRFMTDEEAHQLFDAEAQRKLNMSGEEFLKRWDAGEFPDPDAEGVRSLVMLIPLVRPGA